MAYTRFYAYHPIDCFDSELASVAALTPFNQYRFIYSCRQLALPFIEIDENGARSLLQRQYGVGAGVYAKAPENALLEASRRILARLKLLDLINITGTLVISKPIAI